MADINENMVSGKILVSTLVATALFVALTPGVLFLFSWRGMNISSVFPFPHPVMEVILLHAFAFAAAYLLVTSDVEDLTSP